MKNGCLQLLSLERQTNLCISQWLINEQWIAIRERELITGIPLTFLQLHIESAAFVLQIEAAGRVCAYSALQGWGWSWRHPGHHVLGQSGGAPVGLRGAPCQRSLMTAEQVTHVHFIVFMMCLENKTHQLNFSHQYNMQMWYKWL